MLAPSSQYFNYAQLSYCVLVTLFLFYYNIPSPRLPQFSISQANLTASYENSTAQNASLEHKDFPRKIWQTIRTDLLKVTPDTARAITSWYEKNPNYRYESFTQENGKSYVRERYAHKPDIVETFDAIQDGMLQADLVQYLFLLENGGVYTDLDTFCLKPIDTWIPEEFKNKANLVLGIEGDSLGGDIIPGFTYHVQFATWTMMVKPGHFVLELIVKRVIDQLNALANRQQTTVSNIKASYSDVMDTTGPGIFAKSIYEGLSTSSGTDVGPANLTGMTEPRLFGDILILPITSFAAGLGHSNAGSTNDPAALVQHTFAGSWKGSHPMDPEAAPAAFMQGEGDEDGEVPLEIGMAPEEREDYQETSVSDLDEEEVNGNYGETNRLNHESNYKNVELRKHTGLQARRRRNNRKSPRFAS